MRRYISDHVVEPVHCCQAVDTSCWCLSRIFFFQDVDRFGPVWGGRDTRGCPLHPRAAGLDLPPDRGPSRLALYSGGWQRCCATSSSASIGECLPPNAHALGAGHAPWAGTGLPLPRGTPGGSHAGTGRCPHEHTLGHVAPCLPSAGADLLCLLAGSAASLPLFTMPSAGTGTTPGSSAGPVWPSVVSSPASTPPGAPVALGELPGFGSVPPRLIKKILAKEYVDICRRPGRSKRRAPAATLSARDAAWSLTSTFGRSASPRWRLSWQRHSRPRHRICSPISGPSQRRAGPSSAQPGRPMTWPSAARLPIAVPSIGDMWTPLYTTRPSRAGPSRFLGAAIAWRTHTLPGSACTRRWMPRRPPP